MKTSQQDTREDIPGEAGETLYMIPAGYHCLGGGDPQVTGDLLSPLINWVEHGTGPGAQTFPLVTPAATLPVGRLVPARKRAVVRGRRHVRLLPEDSRR
jgi:hypothetical protein